MTHTLSFFVPGPPAGKGRHRSGQGRIYTPKKTVETEKEVAWEARRVWKETSLLKGPVSLTFEALYDTPKSWSAKRLRELDEAGGWKTSKPDVDNIAKLLKDALNGVVWVDDSQVAKVCCSKKYTLAGRPEGLYITITEL